jgi:hypothetical protein
MVDWFRVVEGANGNVSLEAPAIAGGYVAEEWRRRADRGVSQYVAILVLQSRLAALESTRPHDDKDEAAFLDLQARATASEAHIAALQMRLDELASVPATIVSLQARVAALEAGRVLQTQPKADRARRTGRRDRLPFGWKLDPRDEKRLVPDEDEQRTLHLAQLFAANGLNLHEICRRLDRLHSPRRGKPWVGAHSVLGAILKREGRVPRD